MHASLHVRTCDEFTLRSLVASGILRMVWGSGQACEGFRSRLECAVSVWACVIMLVCACLCMLASIYFLRSLSAPPECHCRGLCGSWCQICDRVINITCAAMSKFMRHRCRCIRGCGAIRPSRCVVGWVCGQAH